MSLRDVKLFRIEGGAELKSIVDGYNAIIDYSVETIVARDALSPLLGETVFVSETGHIYEWNGSSYDDIGSVFGLTGPQGATGATGATGPTGATGATGAKITSAAFVGNDLVFTLDDASTVTLVNAKVTLKGDTGATGNGITTIVRTAGDGSPGTTDTYTITFTDATTTTFQVYNGANGAGTGDFMADGSVPMTGDLNMGDNDIVNAQSIGMTTNPLFLPVGEGQSYWNSSLHCVDTITGIGPILSNGQEFFLYAINNTGVEIADGKPVYLTGSTTGLPTIDLADADAIGAADVIGVSTMTIPNNTAGFVTIVGPVRNQNTSTFAEGATLYLGTTPGEIVDAEPIYPAHTVVLGKVQTVGTTDGVIYVKTYDIPLASEIKMARTAGSSYFSVQHLQDIFHSAGNVIGGEGTDAGGGVLNISGGSGLLRSSNSETATLYFLDYSALNGTVIPSGETRYFGIEWNSGSPQIIVQTTNTWNYYDNSPLGVVTNDGGTLHIANKQIHVGDHAALMIRRLIGVNGIQRDSGVGGLIATGTGTRNLAVSGGLIWDGLKPNSISAIDTSVSGTFDKYLGATLDTAGATQWDNLNYNLSGVKTALGTNKWANFWLYLETDGNLVYVYGTQEFANQAQAQAAGVPSTIPQRTKNSGLIIARGTFQQNASTATITPLFGVTLATNSVSNHADLNNLSWTASGHIDGANKVATFGASGEASTEDISSFVRTTGNQTVGGIKTFTSDIIVPDEVYDATNWDGSLEVPTKNAIRDKIESLGGGGGVSITLVAGENVSAGDPAYVKASDGKAYIANTATGEELKFIGFFKTGASATQSVDISLEGVDENQAGLTIGNNYYLGLSANTTGDGDTVVQSTGGQTGIQGYFGMATAGNIMRTGQEITFSTGVSLRSITIPLLKVGSPTSIISLGLWKASDKTLAAKLTTSSTNYTGTDLTTSYADYTFQFGDYPIEAGVKYFLGAYVDTGNNTNYYKWEFTNSDVYAGGSSWKDTTTGDSWTEDATYDKKFSVQLGAGTLRHITDEVVSPSVLVGRAISATQILQLQEKGGLTYTSQFVFEKNLADAATTTTYTHGLGKTPTFIRLNGGAGASSNPVTITNGGWDSVNGNVCGAIWPAAQQNSTTFCVLLALNNGNYQTGVISNVTSTQFDITWTKTFTPSGKGEVLVTVFG